MAALGMVSKVYTEKILFPRTWESLANIVEIQNKQTNPKDCPHVIFIRQMNF